MILSSVLVPFLIFQGILAVKNDDKEEAEEIDVDFNYLDTSISRTAFYFEKQDFQTAGTYELLLTKRIEVMEQAIAVDEYSCKLDKESGEPSYQLLMKKLSMPGGKRYTQLVLKNGQGLVNLPLATYSDHETYPLLSSFTNGDVIASDTRLYLKKGSTPTNLTLLVYGIFSRLPVGEKKEASKDAYHTIVFNREGDDASITFKSQKKYIDKSIVKKHVKDGEYQRLEAVCNSKDLLV
ncbi:uncharacterized protein LOC129001384 [Macrosteles quadrilineatus]|uniref:uncharacterized protein LOC129001384 n=1 Tax=Macrosteles quadrilineatus TaxID=74068 RepID=UPI0023E31EE3|nr:uncharacterized protein LOC129001384 [Macrosteles quadrilineatus]